MKVKSASDVFEMLGAYVPSVLLGLALELGLFWKLEDSQMTAAEISQNLDIPLNRCRYWLDILVTLDLLKVEEKRYALTDVAESAILKTFSQDAWHNIANESRDSYPTLVNLPQYITEPRSALKAQGIERMDYVEKMRNNPERAERFTRMLYDFHQPLSRNLAEALDLAGVTNMIDLGGGSGIMSDAILSRNPAVRSTIVDLEAVCRVGQKMVSGFATADRITHFPADFITDDLPNGFDLILECDIGVYQEKLFEKLKVCLNPGGRLVIVDQFAEEMGTVPPGRPLAWGFIGSLENPKFSFPTASEIKTLLEKSGFRLQAELQLVDNWLMLDAIVNEK